MTQVELTWENIGWNAYQTLQMLHEDLQTNIIRKDGLSRTSAGGRAIHRRRHMCRRGVELGKEESRLTSTLVAHEVARNGESVH